MIAEVVLPKVEFPEFVCEEVYNLTHKYYKRLLGYEFAVFGPQSRK